MKLVELLAKELKEWPFACESITQDDDGYVGLYVIDDPEPVNGDKYGHVWHHRGHMAGADRLSCIASDAATAIVTRDDWQVARGKLLDGRALKLAGEELAAVRERLKPKKANAGGWVRHRGGNSPVKDHQPIEYRMRSGTVMKTATGGLLNWRHGKRPSDIMAFRIIKPDQQSPGEKVMQDCVEKCASTESVEITGTSCISSFASSDNCVKHVAVDPLQWRNRVFELDALRAEINVAYDRQSAEIAQELESLIEKLAAEGFQLIERVNAQIAELEVKHEGMDDFRNWKAGDMLECLSYGSGVYTTGKLYKFIEISGWGSARTIDDIGKENGISPEYFKWHSRPSK